MRKTHNLSSHHHPWEIQFIAVPLASVRTARVIAARHGLERGVNSALVFVCVVLLLFFFHYCVVVCVIAVSFFWRLT